MCNSNNNTGTLMPFNLKMNGTQSPYYAAGTSHLGMDIQRAQLQDYAQRLQLGLRSFPGQVTGLNPLAYHGHLMHPYLHPYFCKDPRARFVHEEPKPNHSYIGLIAMAILSVRDKKLVLSDIYQWILDNYSYFRTRGPGWRNSIRHNLSLNDCFIKAGRSANGKGHYWAIHPANLDDFQKGDFRRRRAQRRVRKHMGLSVPDDDDDDSPAPSPAPVHHSGNWVTNSVHINIDDTATEECASPHTDNNGPHNNTVDDQHKKQGIRRQFDVESLLAPDTDRYKEMRAHTVRLPIVNLANPSDIFVIENDSSKKSHERPDNSGNENDNEDVYFANSCNKHDNEDVKIHANIVCDGNRGDNAHGSGEENDTVCDQSNVCDRENSSYPSRHDEDKDILAEYREDLPGVAENNGVRSERSSPDNLNNRFSDESGSKNQAVIGEEAATSSAFLKASGFPNTQSIAAFYNTGKQTLLRPVGQVSRFSLIPTQGLLGNSLDVEAAQRWQQSMATLLMKAQMTGRQESSYQIRD